MTRSYFTSSLQAILAMEAIETVATDNDNTIIVFQDDGMDANAHMLTQNQYPTVHATVGTNLDSGTETILVPESYISQDSVLGKDLFIRCTPCNKIFVSANGYNSHVQVATFPKSNRIL